MFDTVLNAPIKASRKLSQGFCRIRNWSEKPTVFRGIMDREDKIISQCLTHFQQMFPFYKP